jgi:acyl-CoA reductase-like NAD-dependent aldehyde dehydrogenase
MISNSTQPRTAMTHGTSLEDVDLATGFYHIVNGKRSSHSGRLVVTNPATGKPLATVPDASRHVLNSTVAAARAAFASWSATPFYERRRQVASILDKIERHIEELSLLLTAEQGRPLAGSRWEIEYLTRVYGDGLRRIELPAQTGVLPNFGRYMKRFTPLGVVCVMCPWNLPVLLSYDAALPALLAGNTVVLKVSPCAPLTALRIADYAKDLLPPGVLNVVTGGSELGSWMASHPGFDQITFIGSTRTGRRVLESAAATLKRVTLELGGNDAAIVLADADPDKIAPALFSHMFMLSGQACIGIKRLYVHERLYPALTAALVAHASRIKTGSGFEPDTILGPVQNELQYRAMLAWLDRIKRDGTGIAFQGAIPADTGGFFVPPTLLDNPSEDAPYVRNEVFGPIRSILRYQTLDEAISRANYSEYGLGASVWGKDLKKLDVVSQRLEAGTVWINQHSNLHPDLPFGGHKSSGIGVQWGEEGLTAFCNPQVIVGSGLPTFSPGVGSVKSNTRTGEAASLRSTESF